MLHWDTGNWSSRRTDGGSFIEKLSDDRWYVYDTAEDGHMKMASERPPTIASHVAGPFNNLENAQAWSEEHQPPREK